MQLIGKLLTALWNAWTARPLAPCCASAIHWSNFR